MPDFSQIYGYLIMALPLFMFLSFFYTGLPLKWSQYPEVCAAGLDEVTLSLSLPKKGASLVA